MDPCSRHIPYFCGVIVTHLPLSTQRHFPSQLSHPSLLIFWCASAGLWRLVFGALLFSLVPRASRPAARKA